ncbi:MAG: hypothetical protein ACSHYB_16110 [Roseibacillus sp.]
MKKQNFLKSLSALLSSTALFAAVSCTPYQQQGAAIGALGGAGLGAIAGDDGGDVATGAALGAAAGAGVSAYRENQQRNANQSYNNTRTYTPPAQRPTYQPPAPKIPTTPARTSNGSIPMATPSIKANTVISPYPPYNVLDTTGASSGDKLCDPSTIPVDPSTGKQYVNPSTGQPDVKRGKYFIVP